MILFDVADIEAHTDQGAPCFDNRDGVEYCNRAGNCENYPDDGLETPAICQDYTTEIDGGHLGSVSAGKIAVAKAFWVLMARIAGWDPDGASPPALSCRPRRQTRAQCCLARPAFRHRGARQCHDCLAGTCCRRERDSTGIVRNRTLASIAVILIAVAGIVVALLAMRHGVGLSPDSVTYIGAARNLADGRGFTLASGGEAADAPITWYPPMYSATLAAAVRTWR